ncbi:hypothetical protein V1509DRAFT_636722 [Lipomyces kononenkoae]
MRTRYRESSLLRQLDLVNKLFTWKCKKTESPDKWVQEWCDVLKEFLSGLYPCCVVPLLLRIGPCRRHNI